MNRQEVAALACRIIAVWLFAQALLAGGGVAVWLAGGIGAIFSRPFDWSYILSPLISLIPAVGYALVAWLLWAKSPVVAQRMVSDDPTPVVLSTSAEELLSIALVITGIFVFLDALHEVVRELAIVARGPRTLWYYTQDQGWSANMIAQLVQAGIGVWIALGSRGLAGMFRKVRGTRYSEPEASEP